MPSRSSYDDHLDVLVALISYLALTERKSRTPGNLAADLSLNEQQVRDAFANFPGLFRRSRNTTDRGEHFYTLHARFALRDADDDDPSLPSLRADILQALLDFVGQRAQAQLTSAQFQQTLKHAWRSNVVALIVAAVAAVAAVVAAFVGH